MGQLFFACSADKIGLSALECLAVFAIIQGDDEF